MLRTPGRAQVLGQRRMGLRVGPEHRGDQLAQSDTWCIAGHVQGDEINADEGDGGEETGLLTQRLRWLWSAQGSGCLAGSQEKGQQTLPATVSTFSCSFHLSQM